MVVSQVATTWLDTHGWVVALGVGVLVFVVSITVGRRPAAMPLHGRSSATPEEIAQRAAVFIDVGASAAVADALAHGDKILAVKRYREAHDASLADGFHAIDAVLTEAVKKPLIAAGASPAVAHALAHGNRIRAIKLYRREQHVGLREAKEAIDRLARSSQTPPHAQT